MVGTAMKSMPTVGISGSDASKPTFEPSKVNAFRISSVIDRLSMHVRDTTSNSNISEFLNLCLSLARGIDFAIANHEVPTRAHELPSLLSQVCHGLASPILKSAIMVLMISVKNACNCGWFTNSDSDKLINLAKEIASNFCSSSKFDSKATCSLSIISNIMSRFYPRMRIGHKLLCIEVKPGFDAYVSGFHISKNLKPSPVQKIRLFIVQTDDITTSSCLISPSKVNFLLNGKGVGRRTTVSMDTGPQIPTDVTHMLKYGSNLLQAVGEFNGNYIIALAFMSELSNPEIGALQDYEQQALATVDSDEEIIEGPSRISLNCPISFKKIKIPVKGHSCKHIQCFDFENYLDMNSRRPSWHCPHCNQYICFTEIRIDRKMVKILEEVGSDVTDVVVESDGSWCIAPEIGIASQKSADKISNIGQEESPQTECGGLSNAPVDALDLTLSDAMINYDVEYGNEDRKFSPTSLRNQPMTMTLALASSSVEDCNRSSNSINEDFWSSTLLSTFGQGSSNVQSNEQQIVGNTATSSTGITQPAVLTDSGRSQIQGVDTFQGDAQVTTVAKTATSLSTILPFSQYQFGTSITTNDFGGCASVPSHLTRAPNTVQALPVRTPASVLQKRPRESVNTYIQNGFWAASQASPPIKRVSNTPRAGPFQVSQQSSSSLHQNISRLRDQSFPVLQSSPPVPLQMQNAYRAMNECQSSTPPHLVNTRMLSSVQSLASFSQPRSYMGVSRDATNNLTATVTSTQQAQTTVAANRTIHPARPILTSKAVSSYSIAPGVRALSSTAPLRINSQVTSPEVTATAAVASAEHNWRPAARMRGALSGQAYTNALNQYIIRPSQQSQSSISVIPSPVPSTVPSQLQSHMTDRTPRPSTPDNPPAESVAGPGASDVTLPEQ